MPNASSLLRSSGLAHVYFRRDVMPSKRESGALDNRVRRLSRKNVSHESLINKVYFFVYLHT